jgi:hypothetical protein
MSFTGTLSAQHLQEFCCGVMGKDTICQVLAAFHERY